VLDEKPIPDVGPLDALVRITTTTICGTDIHILKGEYPVARGLTIGHEPVGVIVKPGSLRHPSRPWSAARPWFVYATFTQRFRLMSAIAGTISVANYALRLQRSVIPRQT
jgi:hypothetical protein